MTGWLPSAYTGAEVKCYIRYGEYDLLEVQEVSYSVERRARMGGKGIGHPRNQYHKRGAPEGTWKISKHYLNYGPQADLFAQLIAGTTALQSVTVMAGASSYVAIYWIASVLYVRLVTGAVLCEGTHYVVDYLTQTITFDPALDVNATVVYMTDQMGRASDAMHGVHRPFVFDVEWRERDSGVVMRRLRGCMAYTHAISNGSDNEPFAEDLEGQFLVLEKPATAAAKVFPWYTGPWPAPYASVPAIPLEQVRAVYQPHWGAGTIYARADGASYANSLLNVAEAGVFDAITGVAPVWNEAQGWTGNGASSYLTTTLVVGDEGQDHAIFVAYTNAGNALRWALGVNNNAARINGVRVGGTTETIVVYNCASSRTYSAVPFENGVVGYSKNSVFFNGALQAGTIPTDSTTQTKPLWLLCLHSVSFFGTSYPSAFFGGTIHAIVIYKPGITPEQAAAVSWAMGMIAGFV